MTHAGNTVLQVNLKILYDTGPCYLPLFTVLYNASYVVIAHREKSLHQAIVVFSIIAPTKNEKEKKKESTCFHQLFGGTANELLQISTAYCLHKRRYTYNKIYEAYLKGIHLQRRNILGAT
jgi:hypothetical protein